jgi:glucokinase
MVRLLGGDVGGTKTLLRCTDDGSVVRETRYESAAHATFDDLVQTFLETVPGHIDASCFAVAGPVLDRRAEVTNLHWTIDADALQRSLPVGRVALINDFYAVALGVPLLGDDDLVSIQRGRRDRKAPIAILGAGTGLGEAIVVPQGARYEVLASEGGHADFGPQDEEQARLFLQLHQRYGHVSSERVVSGMGLVNIFTFLGGEEVTAADIGARAGSGDELANRAFTIFVDAYGAEAGNMALRTLSRGGVYLAGGIAAKNVGRFTDGAFLEAFLRKGRFRDLVATIPVDLITNETVGLIGAMEGARRTLESAPASHG